MPASSLTLACLLFTLRVDCQEPRSRTMCSALGAVDGVHPLAESSQGLSMPNLVLPVGRDPLVSSEDLASRYPPPPPPNHPPTILRVLPTETSGVETAGWPRHMCMTLPESGWPRFLIFPSIKMCCLSTPLNVSRFPILCSMPLGRIPQFGS